MMNKGARTTYAEWVWGWSQRVVGTVVAQEYFLQMCAEVRFQCVWVGVFHCVSVLTRQTGYEHTVELLLAIKLYKSGVLLTFSLIVSIIIHIHSSFFFFFFFLINEKMRNKVEHNVPSLIKKWHRGLRVLEIH